MKVRIILMVIELEFGSTSRNTFSPRCAEHFPTTCAEWSWWQVKGLMDSERFHWGRIICSLVVQRRHVCLSVYVLACLCLSACLSVCVCAHGASLSMIHWRRALNAHGSIAQPMCWLYRCFVALSLSWIRWHCLPFFESSYRCMVQRRAEIFW